MDRVGVRRPVIAKIEKPQAVENLEDIVRAFDGIMVARGDLGVELPLEQVPLVQKRAISLARKRSKPVIVATQVFDSMIDNPRPTRAEASDCANAVMDGADAVMLSGETSVGKFPIECVETMSSIIEYAEEHGMEQIPLIGNLHRTRNGVITRAAMEISEALGVKHLVVFTESGQTARREARLRARLPILCFTPDNSLLVCKVRRAYPVQGYICKGSLRTPAAGSVYTVNKALKALFYACFTHIIFFYKGSQICVKRAEGLSSRPLVLHNA